MKASSLGVIGMATMGRNLALNLDEHGYQVAVWNREPRLTSEAVEQSEGRLQAADTLAELVSKLERPRRLLLMIQAGSPVDSVLGQLEALLEPGDIVMDGGNSWFEDTQRREASLKSRGLFFLGVGVSGGEEGARHGPSLMPGGEPEAYEQVRPVLEAISARSDSGACVTYCGGDGAGHFVKMVHNGIEYADMQLIAEAYDVLRRVGGLGAEELAGVFQRYNEGPLESFLIEITAKILKVKDEQSGQPLVDLVLDSAGQKGTGRSTAKIALELGVSVPSISAAIDARVISGLKLERQAASRQLSGPTEIAHSLTGEALIRAVERALYASKIVAYAQGMALIARGASEYGWHTDLAEIARIWKGGCIIRARLLDSVMQAYAGTPRPTNLLLGGSFPGWLAEAQVDWRALVSLGISAGVPLPAMSASLAYYDLYRTAELPLNLTQAQRDAFGAHTYLRKDDPEGEPLHSNWLSA